jgi:hypothetical protein
VTANFAQTTDLVRFLVQGISDEVFGEIMDVPIGRDVRSEEIDGWGFEFTAPKSEAPRILDILEKHGVKRAPCEAFASLKKQMEEL